MTFLGLETKWLALSCEWLDGASWITMIGVNRRWRDLVESNFDYKYYIDNGVTTTIREQVPYMPT